MSKFNNIFMVLASLIIVTGCVSSGGVTHTHVVERRAVAVSSKSMDDWLHAQALPYIEWESAHNPWLRHRPIEVVPVRDGVVVSEISALFVELRRTILSHLANTDGAEIAWDGRPGWLHNPRQLKNLQCREVKPAAVYLGVELYYSPETGKLDVSIKALDRKEGWIPKFGINWHGKASNNEIAALARTEAPESLRGLRALPYNADQIDMAASFIALNLSCLIDGIDNNQGILVYQAEQVHPDEPPEITKLFNLTDNYLNQLQRLAIVDSKDKANVIMRHEVMRIKSGLYLVWVQTVLLQDGKRLPGTDTEVYLSL
ncbi:MAG TPA: hypothetical protein ENJ30_02820 [Desulfobulbaceae bacterium]|nr:hypothetical protein [Desulfobulbaceae bacterium]